MTSTADSTASHSAGTSAVDPQPIVFKSQQEFDAAVKRIVADQVKLAKQEARTEERSKLRRKLNREGINPDADDGQDDQPRSRKAPSVTGPTLGLEDIRDVVQDIVSKVIGDERAKAEQSTQQLKQEITNLKSNLTAKELEAYRSAKILEINALAEKNPSVPKVIPAMVRGTTKEEIDATIVASQEAYKSVLESVVGKTPADPNPTPNVLPNPVPVSGGGGNPAVNHEAPGSLEQQREEFHAWVGSLSRKEYAAKRDEIKKKEKQLGAKYGT